MSVRFVYRGAFGNNLFQYICARLFAEENGLRLETPWRAVLPPDARPFNFQDAVDMLPQQGGDVYDGPEQALGDHSGVLDHPWPKGRYALDGYFQNSRWYHERREKILSFVKLMPVPSRPLGELLVNVRLGDYWTYGRVIHPSWYHGILSRVKFDHLYIVTDSPDYPYFDEFREKYAATVTHYDPVTDFNTIRQFQRVICSNSSFGWWATFLGHASKVYIFKRWLDGPQDMTHMRGSEPVHGHFFQELQSP